VLGRLTRVFVGVALSTAAHGSCLSPAVLTAQGARPTAVIDGIVSDTNLVALASATVAVLGSALHVTTGESGRFRILGVQPGQYILTVHRVGYVPMSSAIQVGLRDTLRLSFALHGIVSDLDTLVVTARQMSTRLSEFEYRRKLGFGTFLTQEQIERRNAITLGDVLRGIASIKIVGRSFSQSAYSIRTSSCPLQVFVDDVLLPPPANLMDIGSPREIAAIEVYSGPATIPLQYRPQNSTCGVILVWTKTR
jgi:hypothetical protein